MSRPTEYEIWQEIRRLCDAHNLFIVDKEDRIGWGVLREPIYGKVWIVYRGKPRQPGCARLGKRRKLAALFRFVKNCAAVTA